MNKNINKIELRKRNTILKHIEYFYSMFIISFKSMKEYKFDLWSMIFFDIILFISYMLGYTVIQDLTFEYLNWTINDFFLAFIFNLIMWKILWLHNLRGFQSQLLNGELNVALTKPINTYFYISTQLIKASDLISGLILFLISIIFILLNNYINYLFAFLVFIFSLIYFMAFFNFLSSITFFMKENMLDRFLFSVDSITKRFMPKTFQNIEFKDIFYLVPSAVSTYFVIEILNGRLNDFYSYIYQLLSLFVFFIIGIYILWHYGLKKYEAFG